MRDSRTMQWRRALCYLHAMVFDLKRIAPPRVVLGIFAAVAALQVPADLIIGRLSTAWGILINESLFILATPLAILRLSGFSPPSFLPLKKLGVRRLIVAVCFTIGGAILLSYAQSLSSEIIRIPDFLIERQSHPMGVTSWEDFYLKLLLLCLVAPFCEEVLFRGIIQESLTRSMGDLRAVALTSIFFALIHSATFQPHLYLTLGIVLSFIYAATRSLRTAIICHSINNTLVLLNQINRISFPMEVPPGAADAALIALCTAMVAAGAFALRRMMSKRRAAQAGRPTP